MEYPPSQKPRVRPLINATVGRDVDTALRARAEREDRPLSHVVEDVLRRGLGLDPAPATPNP